MESKPFRCSSSSPATLSFSWSAAQCRTPAFIRTRARWSRTLFYRIRHCSSIRFCCCPVFSSPDWFSLNSTKGEEKSISEFCTFFVTSGELFMIAVESQDLIDFILITFLTQVDSSLLRHDRTLLDMVHQNRRRSDVETSHIAGTREVPRVMVEKHSVHQQLLWKWQVMHVPVVVLGGWVQN